MARKRYVPERGDVAWIDLNPQAGHEQAGHRPVVVLSPAPYNRKTNLFVCCPITNQKKGYPFEVPIDGNPTVTGVVLSDQVKSLDWKVRHAQKKGEVAEDVIQETVTKLGALLQISN